MKHPEFPGFIGYSAHKVIGAFRISSITKNIGKIKINVLTSKFFNKKASRFFSVQ